VYYLHQDALGSTRLVATSTVTVKFSSNYVPYGNNYAVSGKEEFMYTGKMDDSATGLYSQGARYYDPNIGRFVTQDSYVGNKNDPTSLNLYLYARDNPEKYVDPSGHGFMKSYDAGGDTHCSDHPDACTNTIVTSSPDGSQTVCVGSLDICNDVASAHATISVTTKISSSLAVKGTASCTAAADVCYWLNYGGTNSYNSNPLYKIGTGSFLIFGGVYATVYTKGIGIAPIPTGSGYVPNPGSEPPTEPPPGTVPWEFTPFGWISEGGKYVFSGSTQLGYTYGRAELDLFNQLGSQAQQQGWFISW
jgi:RHS repeat-associated protein